MPEISRFFGIVVRMCFNDHNPPHFHVRYGDLEAQVTISPASLLTGTMPARVMAMVVEWTMLHEAELLDNWQRLHSDRAPQRITPLA